MRPRPIELLDKDFDAIDEVVLIDFSQGKSFSNEGYVY